MNATKIKTAWSYFAIYIIWGSVYLGVRFVLETLPPFLATGFRFTVAGGLLTLYALLKGCAMPAKDNWIHSAKVGVVAFSLSFGLTAWAQVIVPSSIAALIAALEPAWFVIFDWFFFHGPRPSARVAVAQVIGFSGCAMLVLAEPDPNIAMKGSYIFWVGVILFGNLCWAYGALYSRGPGTPRDPTLASGMQMLCGGVALLIAAGLSGDFGRLGGISLKSTLALCYVILFGSLLAYSSYVYLLRTQPLDKVAAHAFVNPIVAVIVGWAFADERITMNVLIAAALIVISVLMTIYGGRRAISDRK